MKINSPYDQFLLMADRHPRNECIRFESAVMNYRRVRRGIMEAARKLSALNVRAGDVVAVALPNCPESVFLFYS